jgi:hypothetical protein
MQYGNAGIHFKDAPANENGIPGGSFITAFFLKKRMVFPLYRYFYHHHPERQNSSIQCTENLQTADKTDNTYNVLNHIHTVYPCVLRFHIRDTGSIREALIFRSPSGLF